MLEGGDGRLGKGREQRRRRVSYGVDGECVEDEQTLVRFSISNVSSPEDDLVSLERFDEERVGEDGPSNTKREREHQLPTLVSSQILQDHSLLESFISLMDSTEQPYKQHPRVLLGQLERVLVLSDEELWQNQSLLLSFLLSFFLIFSRQKSSSRRRRRRVGEEGSLSDGGR